jgi:hypothetical protein
VDRWDEILDVAEAHGVLGILIAHTRTSAAELPPPIAARMESLERSVASSSFLFASELRGLLREFDGVAIRVVALKGPWLAERIYGDATTRPCRDLDLLVHPSDFAAAERLLESLGFTPCDHRDDYHRMWRRKTTLVELHFEVANPLALDFGLAEAWQRAIPDQFQGVPVWRFAPEDEFLYLCLHAIRHRFDRLSLVVDLSSFLKHYAGRALTGLERRSRAQRIWLTLGLAMVAKFEDSPEPAGQPESLRQLAALLWSELPLAPSSELDWRTLHQFYLQLLPNRAERLLHRGAHLRIALSRLIGEDYRFAERLGLRQSWQVWMLRPIRLLMTSKASAHPSDRSLWQRQGAR